MAGVSPRYADMPAGGPEWLSVTIVNVVEYSAGQRKPARCQVGLVRMPESGEVQLAGQVVGQPLFILPPHSAAKIIGALRDGLSST